MVDNYQNPDEPNTGEQFAQFIFDEWKETSGFGKQVRFNLMSDKKDTGQLNVFIVNLSELWMQLAPKVKGKKFTDSTLSERFMSYEKYSRDPKKIIQIQSEVSQEEIIFGLESVVRQVLEELGITEWGD